MNPQPTIGGLALRILSPRDWLDLSREWLAKEQAKLEAMLKRSGASGSDIAREVERFASEHQSYSVLTSMCKNLDGSLMILERAARRANVPLESLDAAMEGVQPDEIIMCAFRCMGFKIAEPGEQSPNA